eukprot:TRINITY_DN98478_c0_g1_i1.p1 TRINITY_DN98478_c0_g1~~TRINITY_DN98478_c0_g1_i1.p1  ORF type:complete len:302 (+),score=60.67 TRINITY_DN98478_c0_g1_i1:33-938(+)
MVRRSAFSAFSNAASADATAADELLALRGGYQQRLEDERGQNATTHQGSDLRDEAGFIVDEDNPLVYVSAREQARQDDVEYEVVHKRIAIRKRPAINAHVLGACEKGEKLCLFEADETGIWRKLHFRLRGGFGSLVEAWVMLRHEQLGALLRRTDGLEEALTPPAVRANAEVAEPLSTRLSGAVDRTKAAAALAAELGQRLCLLSCQELPPRMVMGDVQRFEVIRQPFTAVRSQPSMDGAIVMTVEYGVQLDTFEYDDSGAWRKVFCTCTASEQVGVFETPLAAWMLVEHPALGPLLKEVA